MSDNLTPEVLADLKAKGLGEKLAVAAANDAGLSATWDECRDDVKAEFERIALAFAASLSHDETATATIQALTARAEKAEQALSTLQQENERLRKAVRPFLPITIRENQDYAEVTFGEHQTQGMTMAPADWLALNETFASVEKVAETKPVTMLVDQDWLSRHVTTDPDASVKAGPDVLAWLSENRNVELSFDYGDADDDGKGWCVHRVNGGVNDREWILIGTGETPLSALRAALQRKGEANGAA